VPLPRKKICPQNDNFYAVFNRQKPWDMDFDHYTKLTKTVQKLSKNHCETKGVGWAVAQSPPAPKYATGRGRVSFIPFAGKRVCG